MITDTHVHLYDEAFSPDVDAVIARAKSVGVHRFFLPAIDSAHTQAMFDLEQKYPEQIFLMAGLHPTHVKEDFEQELALVEAQLSQRKFVAVGETGLDLYWDKTYLRQQKAAFKRQIHWAKDYDLPVVIHCREAFDEIFELLETEQHSTMRGIFHCFTGTEEQARTALNFNFKLGIGGVVTFKNGKIDQFLKNIELEHIVLETDAPYLAPVPYRGKRNEPSYLQYVLKRLSAIYGLSESAIARQTTQNAQTIFKMQW
ncbi:MAG: TatD family hydrolase [Flavobacteriaceae bacterium]|nr:TatD family hydrolase [Flavobacteriaceae bacterium]